MFQMLIPALHSKPQLPKYLAKQALNEDPCTVTMLFCWISMRIQFQADQRYIRGIKWKNQ